ncbi:MAG: hypothetical protein ABSH34_36095 [Verrucomicrobiota bacterium]|jgi:hypothetical protein
MRQFDLRSSASGFLVLALRQRGVTLSVTALGTVLATEAVTATPAGLGAGILLTALTGATAATATSLAGV